MCHTYSHQLTKDAGCGYGEGASTLVFEGWDVWGLIMQVSGRQNFFFFNLKVAYSSKHVCVCSLAQFIPFF